MINVFKSCLILLLALISAWSNTTIKSSFKTKQAYIIFTVLQSITFFCYTLAMLGFK